MSTSGSNNPTHPSTVACVDGEAVWDRQPTDVHARFDVGQTAPKPSVIGVLS